MCGRRVKATKCIRKREYLQAKYQGIWSTLLPRDARNDGCKMLVDIAMVGYLPSASAWLTFSLPYPVRGADGRTSVPETQSWGTTVSVAGLLTDCLPPSGPSGATSLNRGGLLGLCLYQVEQEYESIVIDDLASAFT